MFEIENIKVKVFRINFRTNFYFFLKKNKIFII